MHTYAHVETIASVALLLNTRWLAAHLCLRCPFDITHRFFFATTYTHHDNRHFLINLLFLALIMVPKLPEMRGVSHVFSLCSLVQMPFTSWAFCAWCFCTGREKVCVCVCV